MLVLSRKIGEHVFVGGSVVVTVLAARCGIVRIGIEAPSEVRVLREELASPRDPDAQVIGRSKESIRAGGRSQDGRSCT